MVYKDSYVRLEDMALLRGDLDEVKRLHEEEGVNLYSLGAQDIYYLLQLYQNHHIAAYLEKNGVNLKEKLQVLGTGKTTLKSVGALSYKFWASASGCNKKPLKLILALVLSPLWPVGYWLHKVTGGQPVMPDWMTDTELYNRHAPYIEKAKKWLEQYPEYACGGIYDDPEGFNSDVCDEIRAAIESEIKQDGMTYDADNREYFMETSASRGIVSMEDIKKSSLLMTLMFGSLQDAFNFASQYSEMYKNQDNNQISLYLLAMDIISRNDIFFPKKATDQNPYDQVQQDRADFLQNGPNF